MAGRPQSASSSECSDRGGNELEDSIPQLSFTRPSVGWNLNFNVPVAGGSHRASVFGGGGPGHRLSINPSVHRPSVAGGGRSGGMLTGHLGVAEKTGKRMSLAVAMHQNPHFLSRQSTPVECNRCSRFMEHWTRIKKDFPQLEAIINFAGAASTGDGGSTTGVRVEGPSSPASSETLKTQIAKSLQEVGAPDLRMMMVELLALQLTAAAGTGGEGGRIRSESIAASGESSTSNVATGGEIVALAETSRSSGGVPSWDLGGFKFGTSASRRESTCSHLSLASTTRGATRATATAARTDQDDGTMELNQYLLLEELGHGTQGTVYLGFDQDTQDFRAIKEVKRPLPTSAEMAQLRSEIAIMKRLRHRNIVALHEVIDDPAIRRLYLVLHYAEKGCIARHTSPDKTRCEPLDQGEFVNVARQLTAGLAYLHDHEILHRDIKPENVLRGRNDQVFLADFGVSQVLDDIATQSQSSVPQTALHPTVSHSSLPSAPTTTSPSTVQSPIEQSVAGGDLSDGPQPTALIGSTGNTPKRLDKPLRQPSLLNSPTTSALKKVGSGVSSSATSGRYVPSTRGTPAFFAPEILGGALDEDVDGKAVDVWALGVTFYMLLCGYLPFNVNNHYDSGRQNSVATSAGGPSIYQNPNSATAPLDPPPAAEGVKGKSRVSILVPEGRATTADGQNASGPTDEPLVVDISVPPQSSKGFGAPVDVDWKKYRSNVLKLEVEYPSTLSPVWVEVLRGMLCKNPTKRWTLREVRNKIKKMKIIDILTHLANAGGSSRIGTLSVLETPSSGRTQSPHRHSRTLGPGERGSRASSPVTPKSIKRGGVSPKTGRRPTFAVPELVVQEVEKPNSEAVQSPLHSPASAEDTQYEPTGPGRSPQRLRITVAAAQRHSGVFLDDGSGNLPAPPSGASTEPPSQDPSRRPSSLSLPKEEIDGAFTPVREQSIVPSFESHVLGDIDDASRSNSLLLPGANATEKDSFFGPPTLSTAPTAPDLSKDIGEVDGIRSQQEMMLNAPPPQTVSHSAPSPSLGTN